MIPKAAQSAVMLLVGAECRRAMKFSFSPGLKQTEVVTW